MPKSGARKVVKPVAAAVGIVGTMASIWWFALKPRRKAKLERRASSESTTDSPTSESGPSGPTGESGPPGPTGESGPGE